MRSRSTTTDVSSSPRGSWCGSGTRRRVLIDERVQVLSEGSGVTAADAGEKCLKGARPREVRSFERREFPNRDAIARYDKALALVECPHDLSALVAKLSLRKESAHAEKCSTLATTPRRARCPSFGNPLRTSVCSWCCYYADVPAVTIRNVPEPVRNELAARAARGGRSLQEYLLAELTTLATRPTVEQVLDRARARISATGTVLSRDQIVDLVRADRDVR